jgi:hypothetical protein
MSEAIYTILYDERIGAGDDPEHGRLGNGIVVTLSYWQGDGNWKVSDHYLLTSVVMINRERVVDEVEITRVYPSCHPSMIRKAITRMDQLKELNPAAVDQ